MVNWDSILAYDTIKTVTIRDKTLGALRLIFMSVIFCYVVFKVMLIDKSYNIHDTPEGSVRLSLQSPNRIDMTVEPFCPNHPEYYAEPSSWPFPKERKNENVHGNPIACQAWDISNARFPADELDSIFITTRVSAEKQEYQCGQKNTNVDPLIESECTNPYVTIDGSQEYYFLAGVENFTLGVSTSFYSPQKEFAKLDFFQGTNRENPGKIKIGGKYKYFPSQNTDTPDIITVKELLDAGGIDLSKPSKTPDNSLYYSGMVILVLQRFSNGDFNKASNIEYEYIVKPVKSSDYKLFENRVITELVDGKIVTTRQSIKRAGLKFIFIIDGDFKMFDFQTFLIQSVTAMGLLGMSTFIVELLMLYVMKWRKYYREAKYDDSVEIDLLIEQEKKAAKKGSRDEPLIGEEDTVNATNLDELGPPKDDQNPYSKYV